MVQSSHFPGSGSPVPFDAGPAGFVQAMRAAQSDALARGLGLSAFGHLTLAVAAFLAAALLGGTKTTIVNPPVWPGPPVKIYVDDVPVPGPPPIPKVKEPALPLPVKDLAPEREEPMVHPNSGAVDVYDGADPGVGTTSGIVAGPGTGTGPIEADPDPGVFTFYDEFPQIVKDLKPEYPAVAQAAGFEGNVRVRVLVGTDGRVLRAEIEKSAPLFDDAALAAAWQWVFTPAKSNGHAVKAWVWRPVEFRLR